MLIPVTLNLNKIVEALVQHGYARYGERFLRNVDKQLLYDALSALPIRLLPASPPALLFRVRTHLNESDEGRTSHGPFSYPSAQLCRDNGRAHVYGSPVFYCAHNAKTALMESRLEEGSVVYLSVWRADQSQECYVSVVPADAGPLIEIHSSHTESASDLDQDENDKAAIARYLSAVPRIGRMFVDEHFPYANSSLYTYVIMNLLGIDWLVYPSVIWRSEQVNVAIKKEYAENHLSIAAAYKLRVSSDRALLTEVSLLEAAVVSNQGLQWHAADDEDFEQFHTYCASDSGVFTVTRPDGMDVAAKEKILDKIDRDIVSTAIQDLSDNDRKLVAELYHLGVKAECENKYEQALRSLNKAVRICPWVATLHYHIGICHYGMGKHNDAILGYSSAIRLWEMFPEDPNLTYQAYCNRGVCYLEQTLYERAQQDFKRALDIAPDDHLTMCNMGNCFVEMNLLHDALDLYDKALRVSPDNSHAAACRERALALLKGKE